MKPFASGLHHVGILSADLEPFLELARRLGLEPAPVERSEIHQADFLVIDVGGVLLEIIRPLSPDSPAAQQIEAGRGGVHHLAVPVADAQAALDELAAAGFEMLDDTPRPGLHDSKIGFARVGPALVEVVEPGTRWSVAAPAGLVWQHRTYRLHPDKVDDFVAVWRDQVVPVREQLGFVVAGGWLDEQEAVFVWLVGHEAPDGWEATERDYYASPLRNGIPDMRQFITDVQTRLLRQV
jgi:methylmalonyl-CoA/ethylmalonyl-CoA epimerase